MGEALTQSGAINTGTGRVIVNAGAKAITLTNQNDFRGTVTLIGGKTEITDVNALTLGSNPAPNPSDPPIELKTGSLTAISNGALNLDSGTVTGALSATSNGGNITLGSAEEALELSVTGALTATSNGGNITQAGAITVGGAIFDAGTGDITMTASSSVYTGNVSITAANNADFLMSAVNGIGQLGKGDSQVIVSGVLTLRAPTEVTFNLANGDGEYELTTAQLNNFSVGTLAPTASGVGNIRIGTFNFSGVRNLSLTTTGTGSISANGAITTQTLSMNSGGAATFDVPNRIQNLGQMRVTTGGLSLQNAQGMNLTGTVTVLNGGNANLTVAGQFYNLTGQESPFAGTTGRAVVRSLSLMGGLPNQVSALAGFTPSYNFTDPGTSRAMIYAVSPLAQFAASGTVIAGVDLGGTQTGGGQFNTFLTGSDNLNWMISDFGRFEMPTVKPSGMDYILYPQRVEPETSTLPAATLGQLERELGRPPTLDEIQAREVAVRKEANLQNRPIFERSSFDAVDDEADKQESAEVPVQVIDGGKPQAKSEIQDVDPKTTDNSGRLTPKFRALTPKPILRGGPKSAVAAVDSSEPSQNGSAIEVSAQDLNLDTQSVMEQERVSAEVVIAPPIAGR